MRTFLPVLLLGCARFVADCGAVGGTFDKKLMPGKTEECHNRNQSEWVFQLPGYCGQFTCTLTVTTIETEEYTQSHSRAQIKSKGCSYGFVYEGCYAEDLTVEYPACCPVVTVDPPRCPAVTSAQDQMFEKSMANYRRAPDTNKLEYVSILFGPKSYRRG